MPKVLGKTRRCPHCGRLEVYEGIPGKTLELADGTRVPVLRFGCNACGHVWEPQIDRMRQGGKP